MKTPAVLQYCTDTTGAKSVSRLRNLWQMTWRACVQTLTLEDRTCCCCLSQQWRESSDVSYLGKKKKTKCCMSEKLQKKDFLFVASVDWEPAGTCVDNPASHRSCCVSCWWNQLTSSAVWSMPAWECTHNMHYAHAYFLPRWEVQCLEGSSSQRKVNHIVSPPRLISRFGPFSCHLSARAMASE